MSCRLIFLALVLGALVLVTACGNGIDEPIPQSQQAQPRVQGTRVLPTLYPTATPWSSPTPASTNTPRPTSVPATEVAFDQLVVDVAYSIPALGLERRIRGNVAGEIEVSDGISGASASLKNRPGVIVEMQQALPRAMIEALPTSCDSCVQVSYTLPLTNQSGEGWLRDVQLLASLENFMAAVLGPSFPPGTIAGLRREATPYEVAHSAAVTANGELWAWTATDPQVAEPAIVNGLAEQAEGYLAMIDWSALPETIGYACYEGGGAETLQLLGPDGIAWVEVRCPELYLPGQLVPIYTTLSEAVGERLEGSNVVPPVLPMKLDTTVLYRRADGASLSVASNGMLSAIDVDGAPYTMTVTSTETLSLTTALLNSSLMAPGPSVLFEDEPKNVILVRAYDNVYELSWVEEDEVPDTLVEPWRRLLETVLRTSVPEAGLTPEPVPTATVTDS